MLEGNKETTLGLGERLRSARKARALTLEQAAFSIKVEAAVLRALEDERYDALGAAVFIRGHLKAYARLLGLPEESVLAAYRAADPNADAPPKVTRELEQPLTKAPGPVTIGLAVLFVILAMLVLYALSGGKEPVSKTEPAPTPTPSAMPESVPESAPALAPAPAPALAPAPAPAPAPMPPPESPVPTTTTESAPGPTDGVE